MISTVSMKTFILTLGLTLVIFFIGVSSFFYLFLYRPKAIKTVKAPTISSVKKNLESTRPFILTLAVTQVIFFIGVSSSFYLFLYRPKIINVRKGEREVLRLRKRVVQKSLESERELKKLRREELKKFKEFEKLRKELEKLPGVAVRGRKRPHGLPPSVPPGVRCVDCHLKPAPPN
jgi:ABC-type multidrug transport system fused ATPase/permease subunit